MVQRIIDIHYHMHERGNFHLDGEKRTQISGMNLIASNYRSGSINMIMKMIGICPLRSSPLPLMSGQNLFRLRWAKLRGKTSKPARFSRS
jgi:hypothetical protein